MKVILITGATDGIGRETAHALAAKGHRLLVHGRGAEKLAAVAEETGGAPFQADLSDMDAVRALADAVAAAVTDGTGRLDVLVNNAGVLKLPDPRLPSGLDARFAVSTLAPYLLTKRLLPLMGPGARVVNLSSAAQAPVDFAALRGERDLRDMEAYAQSKLALTAWTAALARGLGPDGPVVVAVNPGSLLATRMVREGFGASGNDVRIGVDILVRAALSDAFAEATGRYFDNDAGAFGPPHPDADDPAKADAILRAVDEMTSCTGRGGEAIAPAKTSSPQGTGRHDRRSTDPSPARPFPRGAWRGTPPARRSSRPGGRCRRRWAGCAHPRSARSRPPGRRPARRSRPRA